jgi:hypothetical protein
LSIRFVRPEVAIIVDTLAQCKPLLPDTADSKRRLGTPLLQVPVKDGGTSKIAAYHNVDVKAGGAPPAGEVS